MLLPDLLANKSASELFQGIYRVSAVKSMVDTVYRRLSSAVNGVIDLSSYSPHVVAAVLKRTLRQVSVTLSLRQPDGLPVCGRQCQCVDRASEGWTGSSSRPWLSRQTGPISSGVTKKLGDSCTNMQVWSPPSIAKGPWSPFQFHSLLPYPPLCDFVPRSLLLRHPVNGVSC